MAKKKTIYLLRTRLHDNQKWSEPTTYPTRKQRDDAERTCRILGGLRTHSYEEKIAVQVESEAANG